MGQIKKVFNSIALMTALSLGIFSVVQAQENAGEKMTVIANVNIYNAEIISQDNNKFKIAFDISNDWDKVQPQVMYSVQLKKIVQNEKNTGFSFGEIVHEKVYPEIISLSGKELMHKEIEYTAPDFLDGKYGLFVNSQNLKGMPLALVRVGEVEIKRQNSSLLIEQESCFISIEGKETQYPLNAGINVTADEKLTINCEIKNYLTSDADFSVGLKILERSKFGELVSDVKSKGTYNLRSQESKRFSFVIKKENVPQSYEVLMVLKDNKQRIISNEVSFRYIVAGVSATVQNVLLDRDYYEEGETAKVSLYVSGSASAVADSSSDNDRNFNDVFDQILLEVVIESDNKKCSDMVAKKTEKRKGTIDFSVPIKNKCINPQVSITAKDLKGNILDTNKFSVTTKSKVNDAQANIAAKNEIDENKSKSSGGVLLTILFSIIFLVVLSVVIYKTKNKVTTTMILFFAMTMFFGAGISNVKAMTFDANSSHCNVQATVSLDNNNYCSGETVEATVGTITVDCPNKVVQATVGFHWKNDDEGESEIVSVEWFGDEEGGPFDRVISYHSGGSATKIAPLNIGDHNANLRLHIYEHRYRTGKDFQGSIPFTVFNYSCTGDIPANATMCVGDDSGLTADIPRTAVSSCTPWKCEYICDDGYVYDSPSRTCIEIPTFVCGNGITEFGEQCDDGNTDNDDSCNNLCLNNIPTCGNGILDTGEECDAGLANGVVCEPAYNNSCPYCASGSCTIITVPRARWCGDGNTDSADGEQCDDGNLVDGDECSSTCQDETSADNHSIGGWVEL